MKIKLGDKNERHCEGPFKTEEEAARAYDAQAAPLGRPVNFPEPGTGQVQASKTEKSSK